MLWETWSIAKGWRNESLNKIKNRRFKIGDQHDEKKYPVIPVIPVKDYVSYYVNLKHKEKEG